MQQLLDLTQSIALSLCLPKQIEFPENLQTNVLLINIPGAFAEQCQSVHDYLQPFVRKAVAFHV